MSAQKHSLFIFQNDILKKDDSKDLEELAKSVTRNETS